MRATRQTGCCVSRHAAGYAAVGIDRRCSVFENHVAGDAGDRNAVSLNSRRERDRLPHRGGIGRRTQRGRSRRGLAAAAGCGYRAINLQRVMQERGIPV